MAISKNWLDMVRNKFHRPSHSSTILPNTKTSPSPRSPSEETAIVSEEAASFEEDVTASPTPLSTPKKDLTKEDIAAIKIQAFFRAYLARRAFGAPTKSVVTNSTNKRMGKSQKCFKIAQRKLRKSSHSNHRPSGSIEEANVREETTYSVDSSVAASSTLSSQKTDMTKEDAADGSIKVRKTFGAGERMANGSKKKRKGMLQNVTNIIPGRSRRRSHRDILSAHSNSTSPSSSTEKVIAKEETTNIEDLDEAASLTPSSLGKELTKEDVAAIKIQSVFRGHRVRQTFRADESTATRSKKKRMGKSQNCFSLVQRRFLSRSHTNIISPPRDTSPSSSTKEAIVKEETIIVKDPNGTAASSTPSRKEELTQEDAAAIKIQAIVRGHRARRAFPTLKILVSSSGKKETRRRTMRMSQNLFNRVRRKFRKTSHRDIMLSHTNTCARSSTDEAIVTEGTIIFENAECAATSTQSSRKKDLTKEDIAAIKIQAFFRRHLARQAFRALKSLVKLQALVRGVCVRRQSRIAFHCMHALARLQVSVRARQLLDGDELLR